MNMNDEFGIRERNDPLFILIQLDSAYLDEIRMSTYLTEFLTPDFLYTKQ